MAFLTKSAKIEKAEWMFKRVWFTTPHQLDVKIINLPSHIGHESIWLKKSYKTLPEVQKCIKCLESQNVKVVSKPCITEFIPDFPY